MRRCLFFIFLGFVFNCVTGQDKILTKDNKQLDVKIVENTGKVVKYKMTDYSEGPVLWIKSGQIANIEYENGVVDLMGNQNPRKDKPLGISIGGAKWISSSGLMFTSTMDYFLTPQVDMEVNMGADSKQILYLSAGARLHINSNYSENRITPFTGALFGYEYHNGFFQIPLGVNYIHKTGINISLSVNEMIFIDQYQTTIELRGGWRFRL
ncbi:MAG TPA: hypothetical protein VMV47_06525 [Bacteroidales bacterium]|nr:hypothetical protein [Bacteroidales bacterium]